MPNKLLKCTGCKERFPREAVLRLPAGNFHSTDCAIQYAHAKQDKQRAKEAARIKRDKANADKAARANHRARKEKLKTKSDWIKEAQIAVNRFIRIRDLGRPCISCGATPDQKRGGTMDAGHYRSRGGAGHLRFNVFNIAGQCVKCNRYNSGNAVDFRIGLIDRIGIDRVERIESDNNPRAFDIDYLKRVKRIFTKRARIYERIRISRKPD